MLMKLGANVISKPPGIQIDTKTPVDVSYELKLNLTSWFYELICFFYSGVLHLCTWQLFQDM